MPLVKKEVSIVGMHCKSCEKMIRDGLMEINGVKSANVSLKKSAALIVMNEDVSDFEIEQAVRRAGYKIGDEDRPIISHDAKDYKLLLVGIIISMVVFLIFSKFQISPQLDDNNSVIYAILMGLTAGFSTCMALIGGLVIGISARHEARHPNATKLQNFQPHIAFNIGRIGGFFALGGLMGLIGSALTFSPTVLGLLTIAAGIFMLVIGLQLTGIFPRLNSISLPPKLAEKLGIDNHKKKDYSHKSAVILGVLTFFLPCGFTQAMQLFAVSTGSPLTGAIVMGLFALGTTPGLLAVGGLTSIINGKKAKNVFKVIGVLVAAMAISSIISGANLAKFTSSPEQNQTNNISSEIIIELTYIDSSKLFEQDEIRLKKGEKYIIEITPKKNGAGCMSAVMLPGLSNQEPQLIQKGKKIRIEATTNQIGTYEFVCAMGVPFNTKVIVEE